MKRGTVLLARGVLCFLLVAATAVAAPSKDEVNLAREVASLDKTASTAAGATAVTVRLRKDFGVSEELVQALRQRGFGYGELTVILAFAAKMPGGATDQNVGKVVALRQGPPVNGWRTVAQRLATRLGPAVSRVKKVHNGARREMKTTRETDLVPREKKQSTPAGSGKSIFPGEGKDMTRGRDAD